MGASSHWPNLPLQLPRAVVAMPCVLCAKFAAQTVRPAQASKERCTWQLLWPQHCQSCVSTWRKSLASQYASLGERISDTWLAEINVYRQMNGWSYSWSVPLSICEPCHTNIRLIPGFASPWEHHMSDFTLMAWWIASSIAARNLSDLLMESIQ